MGERPYVRFDEVKEKVPIAEVLKVFGISNQFRRLGKTVQGVCPLPQHQHGPKPNDQQFKISRKDGIDLWHCFGDCQEGGSVVTFVQRMTGYSDRHTALWFAEHFGDRLDLSKPNGKEKAGTKKAHGERRANSASPQALKDNSNIATTPAPIKPLKFFLRLDRDVPYLAERGVSRDTAAKYGLGLCNRGSLKNYLAIPIYRWPGEAGENPVAYLGRWPGEDYDADAGRPRYKLPEGFEASRVVYGLPQALDGTDGKALVVVEGPFKLFHLVQAGFPSTVSCLSANVSDDQAEILAETGRPIVLLFDGNEAGRQGARRAAARLITKTYVRAVKLDDGMEPDDLSAEQLRELLAFAL